MVIVVALRYSQAGYADLGLALKLELGASPRCVGSPIRPLGPDGPAFRVAYRLEDEHLPPEVVSEILELDDRSARMLARRLRALGWHVFRPSERGTMTCSPEPLDTSPTQEKRSAGAKAKDLAKKAIRPRRGCARSGTTARWSPSFSATYPDRPTGRSR